MVLPFQNKTVSPLLPLLFHTRPPQKTQKIEKYPPFLWVWFWSFFCFGESFTFHQLTMNMYLYCPLCSLTKACQTELPCVCVRVCVCVCVCVSKIVILFYMRKFFTDSRRQPSVTKFNGDTRGKSWWLMFTSSHENEYQSIQRICFLLSIVLESEYNINTLYRWIWPF